jgi:hypothetical protein
MAVPVSDDGRGRDYPTLWYRLCRCGGPQPSPADAKTDRHETWCPYRKEVEGDAGE